MDDAAAQEFESCPIPLASPPGKAAELGAADQQVVDLLASVRSIAVVGMSPNPERTSHRVARWLAENSPYDLYWVNPVAVGQEALGRPFHLSLADLPVVPDMVDVFRRSELVPPVVDDAVAVGARAVWMQLGVRHDQAAEVARDAGLTVVQDLCLRVEYGRLAAHIEAERALRH